MPDPEPGAMTVQQVAAYLQVPVSVIYRAVSPQKPASQRLPGKKIGREWRFNRGAVDEWIAAGHAEADG